MFKKSYFAMESRNKSNSDLVEELRNKLSIVSQERDGAVEMWKLSESVIGNLREELKLLMSQSRTEALKKDMETMQADYSEAIKLLEAKLKSLEKELVQTKHKYAVAEEDIEGLKTKLSFYEEDKRELESRHQKTRDEKERLETERRGLERRLEETAEVALQARDKVKEALLMAQDALANEALLREEKEQLERSLSEVVDEYEQRLEKEISLVKVSLSSRIESLANQLQTSVAEKNKLQLECDSIKAEYDLKFREAAMKFNSLNHELQDVRNRRLSEINQWAEEKELLRRQIQTMEAQMEQAFLELRRREEAACESCKEMKAHIERYRLLAKEWEEAACCVTQEFEKYNAEVQKFKATHKCK